MKDKGAFAKAMDQLLCEHYIDQAMMYFRLYTGMQFTAEEYKAEYERVRERFESIRDNDGTDDNLKL